MYLKAIMEANSEDFPQSIPMQSGLRGLGGGITCRNSPLLFSPKWEKVLCCILSYK